ncbi:hypothetical protein PR202_gb08295 [Eleusine coracana subsp. coracana]|uniref:MYB transcription factor n=1 Tax=Eleusine coracana subsp. coracana TaxID=191504 RepID=A0AAV5EBU9_ELECO|nr:hypothetical protein PR202_gb08295 [Eleusine coracana subsp. coracana]
MLCVHRWSAIAAQLPGRTDNEIKNVWHTHIKKRLQDADSAARKKQPRKTNKPAKNAAKAEAADVDADDAPSQFTAASPGLSTSVSSGVTSSTLTESTAAADNAATTSASASQVVVKVEETESFSTAEFPPIDESFWASADVMDMDLGAMDEELGLASSASKRDGHGVLAQDAAGIRRHEGSQRHVNIQD